MDISRPGDHSRAVDSGRRRFLKLSAPALGLGLAACRSDSATQSTSQQPANTGQVQSAVRYDLTRESGALDPDEVVKSACQFCNSLCRIKVHKKSGRVIGIRGEADDPVAGRPCV